MKIIIKYLSFLSEENTENNIKEHLLENISKKIQIFNEQLKFNKDKKIFEITFSTNFPTKRIDVYVKMDGSKNIKILIKTPFSYGISLYRYKLKKIFLSCLNETLKYY